VKELTNDRKKVAIRAVHKLQKKNQNPRLNLVKCGSQAAAAAVPSSSSFQATTTNQNFPQGIFKNPNTTQGSWHSPEPPPKIPKKLQTQLSSTISSSKPKKKLNDNQKTLGEKK
jgi:hypothetical protein